MDSHDFNINDYCVLSQKEKDRHLFNAIECASLEHIETLLKIGASLEATTFYSNTPLLLATELQEISIVKFLIEKGANLEAKNIEGNTPLLLAIFLNNSELVTLFILAKADLKATNQKNLTPFLGALEANQKIKNCLFSTMSPDDLLDQIKNHPNINIKNQHDHFKKSLESYNMAIFKKIGVLFVRDNEPALAYLPSDLKKLIIKKYIELDNNSWQKLNIDLHTNALCNAFEKCAITPSFSYHASRRQRLLSAGVHFKERIKSKLHENHNNEHENTKQTSVKKIAPSD